jgi:two-component system, NtrC family, response regulator AtoC
MVGVPRREEDLQDTLRAGGHPNRDALARRLIVISDGRAEVHTLGEGSVLIGRSTFSDVMIDHPSISRRHALLRIEQKRATIEDLGSANGTRIGDTILTPGTAIEVHPGDPIDLGSITVVLSIGDGQPVANARIDRPISDVVMVDRRMKRICELVERIAPSNLSVLLLGETGVGKEVLAKHIHDLSGRSGPFLELNCAAISETLLESELFGHEEGAFTGASRSKEGLLESADGGTVLVDEVGELPASMQVKLLRVLETKHVMRIGALRSKNIDIRFVAATNRDLEAEVKAHRFRADLYFRLAGITIHVPPLRDRGAEIEPLARSFLHTFCRNGGRMQPEISREALDKLTSYRWPGNVRELRNAIERAALLAHEEIRPEHLPLENMETTVPRQRAASGRTIAPLRSEVAALERDAILDALDRCGGNQSEAAKLLGISRRTLGDRMDVFGLPRPRKKLRAGG